MKRVVLSLSVLALVFLAGFSILSLWRGSYPYGGTWSPESLSQATELASSNPDPFFRLGLFYHLEIQNVDLKKSLHYLGEAVGKNPLQQEYWLVTAKVLQRMEQTEASQKALEKAIMVFPTSYAGRWTAGNLLLQQGEHEKAISHFSYILTHYPNQGHLVYDVCGQVFKDHDFLLEKIIPKNSSSLSHYLSYLYEAGEKGMVKKVWKERAHLGYKAERAEALRYIEFLISCGELPEAFQAFEARLREEGLPTPSRGNLIINGGFENEKTLGGGFDWKIKAVPGAEISFDEAVVFEGKKSLKISFNGKENVDFHHVWQYVALKPGQEYILKAHIKTHALTTKSGIKLEVSGLGLSFHQSSELLTGDNEWRELTVAFKTPSQSQGGVVRVRRERTDKFDRFISGTVWVDNVHLMEKSY